MDEAIHTTNQVAGCYTDMFKNMTYLIHTQISHEKNRALVILTDPKSPSNTNKSKVVNLINKEYNISQDVVTNNLSECLNNKPINIYNLSKFIRDDKLNRSNKSNHK